MKGKKIRPLVFILLTALCLLYAATPLLATSQVAVPKPVAGAADDSELSITELYDKVKDSRQTLLENRLEVVKKANEAKQRLEELLLKNSKGGNQSAEALKAETLKKDLETIKEAQRVLTSILSDIVCATAEAAEDGKPETGKQAEGGTTEKPKVLGTAKATGNTAEIMPSREYLESLIPLYDEKSEQLTKVIESLNGIVPLN